MQIDEARRILGLQPGEDASVHLAEFEAARELIAEMVRSAPNDTIALRYQEGLMEFDRALASLREEQARVEDAKAVAVPAAVELVPDLVPPVAEGSAGLPPGLSGAAVFEAVPEDEPAAEEAARSEAVEQVPTPEVAAPELVAEELVAEEVVASATPGQREEEDEEETDEAAVAGEWGGRRRFRFPVGAVLLALLVVIAAGGWVWMRLQEDARLQRQARISYLERQGAIMVENRRWDEAVETYREIERLDPGSPLAALGHRSIEAGMTEEQNQFLAYWQGEALAAFEAGRWDDAERAIRTVVAKVPGNPEMVALQGRIAEERRQKERGEQLAKGRAALDSNRWDEAADVARAMLDRQPGDREAGELLLAANAGRERERENRGRARELLAMARQRDSGQFDQQALEWVREAARLAPGDPEVAALYQKLSGYTRTLKVPGDHDTIGAAVAAARPKDRIVVGKGAWKESVVVDRVVEIEGAGADESRLECPAGDGPVIVFAPEASGSRVSGIGFRHLSFAGGNERFSAVVVRGGQVVFDACQFREASGHGLAVIEGGLAATTGCRFEGNGWDGAAAYGEGSRLEVIDSQAIDNFEHGIDAWNGASILVRGTTARGNGRNGICVNTPAETVLDRNKAEANREFGIVLVACQGGQVSANSVARNELGGMAFHREARGLQVRGNTATRNEGPGLVFDEGFAAAVLEGNNVSGNRGPKQVIEGIKLDANAEVAGEGSPR